MPKLCHALVVPALVFAGCSTPAVQVKLKRPDPQSQKTIADEEKRLIEPFQHGHTVLCRSLDIQANPLFFKHLTFPAGRPRKGKVDGSELMTWTIDDAVSTRKLGKPLKPYQKLGKGQQHKRRTFEKFKIIIGSTVFMVDDRVTVRSLNRAAPTLTALASGHVMLIQDGKKANTFKQVRYSAGKVAVR